MSRYGSSGQEEKFIRLGPVKLKPLGCLIVTIALVILCIGLEISTGVLSKTFGPQISAMQTQIAKLTASGPASTAVPPGAVGIPPVPVATQVPSGQVQPTVRATAPTGTTTVPAQPPAAVTQAAAAAAACQGKPEIDVALVPFGPYFLWVLPSATGADCRNGVKLNFVLLEKEEELVQWVTYTAPDKYFPPLTPEVQKDPRYVLRKDATGKTVTRMVLTTQNSCVFYGNCRLVSVLGVSDKNDALLVNTQANPPISTWDDIAKRRYLGGAVGNVNEYMPKAMGLSCGRSFAGDFQPRLTSEQAGLDFVKGQADVLSDYEPYITDALKKMGGRARVAVSSGSFVGILDVVLTSSETDPNITAKAVASMREAMVQGFAGKPEDMWDKIWTWANTGTPEQVADRMAILGPYTSHGDWWPDIEREALFTPEQELYVFGAGKSILVERVSLAQQTFAFSPSFHSGGSANDPRVFFPAKVNNTYVDPNVFVDSRAIDLIRNDPRMKVPVKVPNNNIRFTSFAPNSTGTTVLSNLPLLDVQFRTGSADFADPVKAQSELADRTLQCLKFFKVNLRITVSNDDLGQTRADRVKIFLTRNLAVPEYKIVVVRTNTVAPGTVQFAIVGNEE